MNALLVVIYILFAKSKCGARFLNLVCPVVLVCAQTGMYQSILGGTNIDTGTRGEQYQTQKLRSDGAFTSLLLFSSTPLLLCLLRHCGSCGVDGASFPPLLLHLLCRAGSCGADGASTPFLFFSACSALLRCIEARPCIARFLHGPELDHAWTSTNRKFHRVWTGFKNLVVEYIKN